MGLAILTCLGSAINTNDDSCNAVLQSYTYNHDMSQPLPVVDLSDIRVQFPIKHLTPDGHLQLVERVLHNIVRVQLVDPPRGDIHVRLRRISENEELGTRHGVEALKAKVLRLHDLQARGRLIPAGQAVGS